MPGGPGLGTGDKAENKTASPCPWGAHGAEKEAKQTPNQEMTMQGDEGCAKGALGGGGRLRGHRGGPSPALAGGTVALLLTAEHRAPSMLGSRVCAD